VSARSWTLSFVATTLAVVACGARSELDLPGPEPADAAAPTCEDGGVTFIYVVTEQGHLLSFYPPSGVFSLVGAVHCPVKTPGATPWSMAVDRGGTAYVVFDDGNLYRVSTNDASCEATSFVADQHGFLTFGMGFSADMSDPGETLFVAQSDLTHASQGLATLDTTTLALSFIGPFSSSLGRTELTGTGDGRLFGFSLDVPGPGSHLSEIDKATAQVLSSTPLPVGDVNDAFACAFWGGSFYVFTAQGATTVTRYDPADQSLHAAGQSPETIVGAGVSTCAPH
jgi:hypothetical protein